MYNGDVKLEEDGTPLVYWNYQWMPICGHYFWDNQNGAKLFCKKMGYDSGVLSGRNSGQKYGRDSFRIGKCESGDEWMSSGRGGCRGGCNDYQGGGSCRNNGNAKCDKHQAAKFTIKCSGGKKMSTLNSSGKRPNIT